MNLGFDIDGCINCFPKDLRDLLREEYELNEPDCSTYNMLEQLGYNDIEHQREFYKKHQSYFESKLPAPGSVRVINKYSNENTYIITARCYDEAEWTERWLNKHGILRKETLFNCENKVGACKLKKIDVMVEDNPYNAQALAEAGIMVLLFDQLYNRDIKHDNIIRCYNWEDVEMRIEEMLW